MICPNCKSEIGSQPSCPYCGVVVNRSTTYYNNYPNATVVPTRSVRQNQSAGDTSGSGLRKLERKISSMDMKLQILMILCGGMIALQLLIIILMTVK